MRTPQPRAILRILALALVATGAAFASAEPVAILVKMEGAVEVQRAGAQARGPATVGMHLMPGDRVLVPESGRAVLLYKSGKMQNTTQSVEITAPEGGEQEGLFSRTVRTLDEVATTDASQHPNRQGMIRPIAGEPVPIAPRNGIKVLDDRPTFTWFTVPGAERYIVQLRRMDGSRPVRFDVGTDTTWTYPADAEPLVRGATYRWTVGPIGRGRVAPEQSFTVLTDAERRELARTFDDLAAAGLDPESDGLFLAALTYRNAGLFYEAAEALARLERTGDAGGPAFHMLRGEVYDALGQLDEAAHEFELARADSAG